MATSGYSVSSATTARESLSMVPSALRMLLMIFMIRKQTALKSTYNQPSLLHNVKLKSSESSKDLKNLRRSVTSSLRISLFIMTRVNSDICFQLSARSRASELSLSRRDCPHQEPSSASNSLNPQPLPAISFITSLLKAGNYSSLCTNPLKFARRCWQKHRIRLTFLRL